MKIWNFPCLCLCALHNIIVGTSEKLSRFAREFILACLSFVINTSHLSYVLRWKKQLDTLLLCGININSHGWLSTFRRPLSQPNFVLGSIIVYFDIQDRRRFRTILYVISMSWKKLFLAHFRILSVPFTASLPYNTANTSFIPTLILTIYSAIDARLL